MRPHRPKIKKVISSQNLKLQPLKLFVLFLLIILYLDRYNISDLVRGIIYGFYVVIQTMAFIPWFREDEVMYVDVISEIDVLKNQVEALKTKIENLTKNEK